MMVSFQDKIIYLPDFPAGARQAAVQDFAHENRGLPWCEYYTRSADGTQLAMAVASVAPRNLKRDEQPSHHVYILYLQGNASSPPARLGDHSSILQALASKWDKTGTATSRISCTQVDLAYRGYWKSDGRPSEIGINQDAIAAADWILQMHKIRYHLEGAVIQETLASSGTETQPLLIVWGQSLGAGFATNLISSGQLPKSLPLIAVVLETPFTSCRAMIRAVLPQKWVPHRLLGLYLRTKLDSYANLEKAAKLWKEDGLPAPCVLILQAERDEVVPYHHAVELEQRCMELNIPVKRHVVSGALHSEGMLGWIAIASFIDERVSWMAAKPKHATASTRSKQSMVQPQVAD